MELFCGTESRPLFRAHSSGFTVFATGSSTEWDETEECWLETRWKYQPVTIPWNRVTEIAAGPESRRLPSESREAYQRKSADCLVILTEVEPSLNLNDYFFSSQGYEQSDLIGLSREEWTEDDLVSRVAIPAARLPGGLDDAVSVSTTLWVQSRESPGELEVPELRRKEASKLTKGFLRWLGRKIGD